MDPQFGAGHLNVTAAVKQYRAAEWAPGVVANIGWDYGTVAAFGTQTYIFNRPLAEGEVIAATLCWDRRVETINPNPNNHLDGFFDYQDLDQVLTDLDIYLQPAGADPNDPFLAIWGSISEVDNVEHMFVPVPFAGAFQIVVKNTQYGLLDDENYGLAWWAGESIPGDFDGDGKVDAFDLPKWKTGFGTSEADADDDGDSDGDDFLAWQRNLGFGVPAVPVGAPVPESGTRLLCCAAISLVTIGRRR